MLCIGALQNPQVLRGYSVTVCLESKIILQYDESYKTEGFEL